MVLGTKSARMATDSRLLKRGKATTGLIQFILHLNIKKGGDEQCPGTQLPTEDSGAFSHIEPPEEVTHDEAMCCVDVAVTRARGSELPGNFHPLVITELFWEQFSR